MPSQKPLPTSNEGWVIELIEAYQDAKAAIPFAEASGHAMTESDLFHMAPLVCLKFRDLVSSEECQKNARQAAIGSYVANLEAGNRNLQDAVMAFSFCYLTAHFGLGLLSDDECQEILGFVESNLTKIKNAV